MPFGGTTAIQLWFPAAEDGFRLVRCFSCWLPDSLILYLAGCCLWSRRDTGQGAQAAVIYGPDRVAYRIEEATRTCGQIPAVYLELLRNSESSFRTSDPLPA
ncbi:hypothetical protein [Catenulispora pinisilvae]|uniref:hypothetical protein n=1 Tax=Catenulispora pinisilvae TaxID=2705253 RepID=UPI001891F8BA|nr:hypothetical protein [Catenulispora pinisilvae]